MIDTSTTSTSAKGASAPPSRTAKKPKARNAASRDSDPRVGHPVEHRVDHAAEGGAALASAGPGRDEAALEAAALALLRELVDTHSSARAVADAMGQAHNYVARILRGETKLRLDVLQRILETLGVPERAFFELATQRRRLDAVELLAFFGGDGEVPPRLDAWQESVARLLQRPVRAPEPWSPSFDAAAEPVAPSQSQTRIEIEQLEEQRLGDKAGAETGLGALLEGLLAQLEMEESEHAQRAEDTDSARSSALESADLEDLSLALAAWSTTQRYLGRRRAASRGLRMAIRLAEHASSDFALGNALQRAGVVLRDIGHGRVAQLFLDWASDAYLRCGAVDRCQRLFVDRAVIWIHLGEYACAVRDYEIALRQMPEETSSTYWVAAFSGLSHGYQQLGDLRRAIAMNHAAEKHFDGGQNLQLAHLMWNRGNLAAAAGENAVAADALGKALNLLFEHAEPIDSAICSLDLAEVFMRQGEVARLRGLADEILAWLPALRGNRLADATMMEWIRCVKWGEISQKLLDASRRQLESSRARR